MCDPRRGLQFITSEGMDQRGSYITTLFSAVQEQISRRDPELACSRITPPLQTRDCGEAVRGAASSVDSPAIHDATADREPETTANFSDRNWSSKGNQFNHHFSKQRFCNVRKLFLNRRDISTHEAFWVCDTWQTTRNQTQSCSETLRGYINR